MLPAEKRVLTRISQELGRALMNPPSRELTATKWWARLMTLAVEVRLAATARQVVPEEPPESEGETGSLEGFQI